MSLITMTSVSTTVRTPIKVLVVDDSAFMRKMVTQILAADPDIDVVGQARDGEDGLSQIERLQPDVITLDVEMPRLGGIDMLKRLMETHPIPVVMVSSTTKEGAEVTLECLAIGAVDFVCKPSGSISLDIEKVGSDIIAKVKTAAQARIRNRAIPSATARIAAQPVHIPATIHPVSSTTNPLSPALGNAPGAIVIGSSTGGPRALQTLIPEIPSNIGAPIIIVQHMPPTFTATLASRLNQMSQIEVREAKNGDALKPNVALVAPGGFHLEFDQHHKVVLTTDPPLHGIRPAVDITVASLCKLFGKRLTGILLTGMGKDGARGMKTIRDLGGYTIAEHESTCVIYGMPKSAVDLDGVDAILPLHQIASHLAHRFNCSPLPGKHAA